LKKEFIISGIIKDQFTPFKVNEAELISYALSEAALISDETEINGESAQKLVQSFYEKRDRFRHNTRLGHLLLKEYGIKKDQLIKALVYHEEKEVPLGEAFVQLQICSREQVDNALKKQYEMRSYFRD